MQQWEFLESAAIDGGGYMELMRRGTEMIIRVDGRELMGNRVHGSEDALADLALDHLKIRNPELNVAVLIGGLGIGFTLAAALKRLGESARVTVAELTEAVVRWNDGPLGEASGHPVRDERATVYVGDVQDQITQPSALWDAILLDVDNGPSGLTREGNNWLYSPQGLRRSREALTEGGVLAVWSAFDDTSFTNRMKRAGFKTTLHKVRSRGAKGGHRHYIWLGEK